MPIVVQHQPAPSAIGQASFIAGEGQRRERDIRQANQLALAYSQLGSNERDRQERLRLAYDQLAINRLNRQDQLQFSYDQLSQQGFLQDQSQQNLQDRFYAELDHREKSGDKNRQFQSQESEKARQARMEMARFQADEQKAMLRRKQAAEAVRSGAAFYTQEQKVRLSKLQNELGKLSTDKRLNEEQRRDAARQLQEGIDGIIANPQWRTADERPKSIEEQVKSKIYYDSSGQAWTVNKDGDLMAPRGWQRDNSRQDKAKFDFEIQQSKNQLLIDLEKEKRTYALELMKNTKTDADGKPTITAEEAFRQADERFSRAFNSIQQMGSGQVNQPQVQQVPQQRQPQVQSPQQSPQQSQIQNLEKIKQHYSNQWERFNAAGDNEGMEAIEVIAETLNRGQFDLKEGSPEHKKYQNALLQIRKSNKKMLDNKKTKLQQILKSNEQKRKSDINQPQLNEKTGHKDFSHLIKKETGLEPDKLYEKLKNIKEGITINGKKFDPAMTIQIVQSVIGDIQTFGLDSNAGGIDVDRIEQASDASKTNKKVLDFIKKLIKSGKI